MQTLRCQQDYFITRTKLKDHFQTLLSRGCMERNDWIGGSEASESIREAPPFHTAAAAAVL